METVKKPWLQRNWYYLLAVVVVPILAGINAHERTESLSEYTATFTVTEVRTGSAVKLKMHRQVDTCVYADGTELPVDGAVVMVVTWAEYKLISGMAPHYPTAESDYPIVVFANKTGFDATLNPVAIRRSKDGVLCGRAKETGKDVGKHSGLVVLQPSDSNKRVTILNRDGSSNTLDLEAWLQAITSAAVSPKHDAGLTVRVSDIRGDALAGVKVYIMHGEMKPVEDPSKHAQYLAVTNADGNGDVEMELDAGVYTVVVEYQGKLYGNSIVDMTVWPSVTAKSGQKKLYEFHLPVRKPLPSGRT